MTNNNLSKTQTKQTFTQFLGGVNVRAQLNNIFRNEKECAKFVSSIASAVSTNPKLAECEYSSIVSAALLANALNLSLSPQLGLCYLVPFKDKKLGRTVATFVLGYRGYIQLAIRSGYYTDLDVMEIKEGEYVGRDEDTGKCKFHFIADDVERDELETVGYMAYFVQANGFKKVLFWTKEKMQRHADKYSAAFSLNGTDKKASYADFVAGKTPKEDEWKYSSFWYSDFDGMAFKTMIRQLISKWGIMSIDMQKAFENDKSDGINYDVVDSSYKPEKAEIQPPAQLENKPVGEPIPDEMKPSMPQSEPQFAKTEQNINDEPEEEFDFFAKN